MGLAPHDVTLDLASKSPRRREILRPYFRLRLVDADIDEALRRGERPLAYVRRMALEKWQRAASLLRRRSPLLLAADTTVYCGSRIFGKATDRSEARSILKFLSGRIHKVATAVALGKRNLTTQSKATPTIFVVISQVRFRRLSESEIESYLQTGEWKGKAGAYAIQGRAALFVESIEGSLTNIIGLPLAETLRAIAKPSKGFC